MGSKRAVSERAVCAAAVWWRVCGGRWWGVASQ